MAAAANAVTRDVVLKRLAGAVELGQVLPLQKAVKSAEEKLGKNTPELLKAKRALDDASKKQQAKNELDALTSQLGSKMDAVSTVQELQQLHSALAAAIAKAEGRSVPKENLEIANAILQRLSVKMANGGEAEKPEKVPGTRTLQRGVTGYVDRAATGMCAHIDVRKSTPLLSHSLPAPPTTGAAPAPEGRRGSGKDAGGVARKLQPPTREPSKAPAGRNGESPRPASPVAACEELEERLVALVHQVEAKLRQEMAATERRLQQGLAKVDPKNPEVVWESSITALEEVLEERFQELEERAMEQERRLAESLGELEHSLWDGLQAQVESHAAAHRALLEAHRAEPEADSHRADASSRSSPPAAAPGAAAGATGATGQRRRLSKWGEKSRTASASGPAVAAAPAAAAVAQDAHPGHAPPGHGQAAPGQAADGHGPPHGHEFEVTLDRSKGEALGISFLHEHGYRLIVTALSGGLVADWNHRHPQAQVELGHRLVQVNGAGRGNAAALLAECDKHHPLVLTFAVVEEEEKIDP